MAPKGLFGEGLLDGVYLKSKLEKLWGTHVHTEQLMDRWASEAKAKKESKTKPRRKKHVKTKGRKSNREGRKGSSKAEHAGSVHEGTVNSEAGERIAGTQAQDENGDSVLKDEKVSD